MTELLPLFINLSDRSVVLVGAGRVAAGKLRQLQAAGARVSIVAPEIGEEIGGIVRRRTHDDWNALHVTQRAFVPEDLDDAWFVVAAATPAVNRQVAKAAEARRVFVNAVDDPPNASAFLSGVIRRDGVTLAISTSGDAPALTALLREGLDALLPHDLGAWMARARAERIVWRRDGVPMSERKPLLLRALNDLYEASVPWLNAPEDSWL
jgi:siroheme synthase-like protein